MGKPASITWSISEVLEEFASARNRTLETTLVVFGYIGLMLVVNFADGEWDWQVFFWMIVPFIIFASLLLGRGFRKKFGMLTYTINATGITLQRGERVKQYSWHTLSDHYYRQKDVPFIPNGEGDADWRDKKYTDRKILYLRYTKSILPNGVYLHIPPTNVARVLAVLGVYGRKEYIPKTETRGQFRARMVFAIIMGAFALFCFAMAIRWQVIEPVREMLGK